jgi:hypothetical protein
LIKMRTSSTSGDSRNTSRVSCCQACGARLAYDQRYCVECGVRRGALPPAIAERIGVVPRGGRGQANEAGYEDGVSEAAAATDSHEARSLNDLSASVSGVAVIALLAFGVLVGSAVSPAGQSRADAPIVVAVSPSTTASSSSPPAPVSTPPSTTEAAVTPVLSTPTGATPESTGSTSTAPASTPNPQPGGASEPSAPTLPPITHVFLIVLSSQGFNAAFGPSSQAPYLSKTLTGQGELLNNYYAVSGGELANEIALISGQGPTPQTAANCPLYTDITPGTVGAQGQVLGSGCVYPRQALTLGDQLTAEGRGWKAYIDGSGASSSGQPATCLHPAFGSADPNQNSTPAGASVTWRDPFVYFHSVIDNTTCSSSVVGLDQLAPDFQSAAKTPSLAYIVPDRCHDGSDQPCAPGQSSGLAAADSFLRKVVPEIQSSPAYKTGGLIAITFDQAPQSGTGADSSGCCITPAYPNLPTTTGATGTTGTGTTVATGTTAANGTTGATGTTGMTGITSTTPTTGTTTATAAGGGRVGLLLISKYVKPGSLNVSGEYNHFSLLASIENLFGQSHLGYAGTQGLLAFDTSVYNAHK